MKSLELFKGVKEETLKKAQKSLEELNGEGKVEYCVCNVTYSEDIQTLISAGEIEKAKAVIRESVERDFDDT